MTYPDGKDLDDYGCGAAIYCETGVLDWPVVSKCCGSYWPPSTGTSKTLASFAFYPLFALLEL